MLKTNVPNEPIKSTPLQTRPRLYWTNKPYEKIHKEVYLKDVLDLETTETVKKRY